MPRRTRAEAEATAEAVLETAVAMFAEQGYAAVGLAAVAAEAGVTRGAVYHHYADKPALFAAALARVQAEVGARVAAAADAVDDPWVGFEAGCRAFLEASVDDRARRIMLLEAPGLVGWEEWLRLDGDHAGRMLDEVLAELVSAGLLDVPSVPAAEALLSGAMNQAALWVAGQDDREVALEQAWSTLRVLLGSLRA